jgi:adenylate kinase
VRVVFLGAPGVGKGTQAEILCRDLGLDHVSTGNLLREAVQAGTPRGRAAKQTMDRGDLVGDDIILGLIEESLDDLGDKGFVLDGFPRNAPQAKALDRLLERKGLDLDGVVLITVSKEEVLRRLRARGRDDDTPETIRRRFEVYEETTRPLVDFYREKGILVEVNGVGSIGEIQGRIRFVLGR